MVIFTASRLLFNVFLTDDRNMMSINCVFVPCKNGKEVITLVLESHAVCNVYQGNDKSIGPDGHPIADFMKI